MTLPRAFLARAWWRQPSATMVLALAASLVIYPFADSVRHGSRRSWASWSILQSR